MRKRIKAPIDWSQIEPPDNVDDAVDGFVTAVIALLVIGVFVLVYHEPLIRFIQAGTNP